MLKCESVTLILRRGSDHVSRHSAVRSACCAAGGQSGGRSGLWHHEVSLWRHSWVLISCLLLLLSSLSYRHSLFSSSQDVSSRSGHRCWKKSHRRAFKQGTVNTWICLMTSLIQVNTAVLTLTLSRLCVCRCFRMWWSVCSSQTSQRKLWWVSSH